jgi:hypothetical protein
MHARHIGGVYARLLGARARANAVFRPTARTSRVGQVKRAPPLATCIDRSTVLPLFDTLLANDLQQPSQYVWNASTAPTPDHAGTATQFLGKM